MRKGERMVTFYQFPKAQWQHLRTTNPVESLTNARSSRKFSPTWGCGRIPAFAKASTYAAASVDKSAGKPLMPRLTSRYSSRGSVFTLVNAAGQVVAKKALVRAQRPCGSAPTRHRAPVS